MSFWCALNNDPSFNEEHLIDLGNQTYNHCRIFYSSTGIGFRDFHSKQAKNLILFVKLGLARIECDEEYYLKLEPKNGWGSLEAAVDHLRNLLQACIEYPESYYYHN